MSSRDADLDASLVAAFVAGLPEGAVAAEPAVLGPALAAVVARGCAACPEVDPIALAGYLGRRCPGGAVLDHLEAIDGEELALAWACADGASVAIARFEARYFGELRVGVARLGVTADELAEVTQEVRRALFADLPPRLLGLTARGELRALLRLMAVRAAISARRRAGRAPLVDDGDDPLALLDDGPSPSAQVARAQHREALRAALAVALAALSPRDRTILRLHALDGVSLAALATMHRVDRATISRWIAAAREQIYRETRRALTAQRGVAAVDFDSFVDVLRSRFELSLRDALAR